jgi:DNA-binding protein Fis
MTEGKFKEYQQGYEQGINDLADRLKTYYNNLNGTTSCGLVAYHIDQIRKEMLEKAQNCD